MLKFDGFFFEILPECNLRRGHTVSHQPTAPGRQHTAGPVRPNELAAPLGLPAALRDLAHRLRLGPQIEAAEVLLRSTAEPDLGCK